MRDVSREFGKGLKSTLHWQKDDVLVIFASNHIDAPAVIWGCLWAGGVVSPASSGSTPDELAFQLRDARAKAVVTQLTHLKTALEAAKKVGLPEKNVILMGDERDASGSYAHFTDVRAFPSTSGQRPIISNPEKELAYLPYSSGTTGRPKGVMLSHRNITSNVLMMFQLDEPHMSWRTDKLLACIPFSHIYGWSPELTEVLFREKMDQMLTCWLLRSHCVNPYHLFWRL